MRCSRLAFDRIASGEAMESQAQRQPTRRAYLKTSVRIDCFSSLWVLNFPVIKLPVILGLGLEGFSMCILARHSENENTFQQLLLWTWIKGLTSCAPAYYVRSNITHSRNIFGAIPKRSLSFRAWELNPNGFSPPSRANIVEYA